MFQGPQAIVGKLKEHPQAQWVPSSMDVQPGPSNEYLFIFVSGQMSIQNPDGTSVV